MRIDEELYLQEIVIVCIRSSKGIHYLYHLLYQGNCIDFDCWNHIPGLWCKVSWCRW
jgi:hypothetical protein